MRREILKISLRISAFSLYALCNNSDLIDKNTQLKDN